MTYSGKQSWLIKGQAGTPFVCMTCLVIRGIRLVPRTCFSPQKQTMGARLIFLGPSLARSREAHFACPNRRACSQATAMPKRFVSHVSLPSFSVCGENRRTTLLSSAPRWRVLKRRTCSQATHLISLNPPQFQNTFVLMITLLTTSHLFH